MLDRAQAKVMDTQFTLQLPHVVAVVLALLAGAAQVINQTVANLPAAWHSYLGLGVAIIAYAGIKPLVGDEFRTALPAPAWVSQTLTFLAGAATIVAGQLPASPTWVQATLAATTTVLLALGFGPAGSHLVDAKRARAAARKTAKPKQATTVMIDRQWLSELVDERIAAAERPAPKRAPGKAAA